jgi:hypothetical protein
LTRYAITKEELEALNPCDLDERLKLFGGRERLTVAHALEAGVTVSDVLWTAGRMGHKAECVRFAVACAESVAHLSHDPRVRAAIEAAKAWIASPTEENAAATYVAAYAADAAGVVAAHRGARAAAYAARTASYAAADAAAYAADAARTASYAAKAEEQAKYAADAAGEPFDGKTLLLKIFADKGGRTMTQKLETEEWPAGIHAVAAWLVSA